MIFESRLEFAVSVAVLLTLKTDAMLKLSYIEKALTFKPAGVGFDEIAHAQN